MIISQTNCSVCIIKDVILIIGTNKCNVRERYLIVATSFRSPNAFEYSWPHSNDRSVRINNVKSVHRVLWTLVVISWIDHRSEVIYEVVHYILFIDISKFKINCFIIGIALLTISVTWLLLCKSTYESCK